MRQSLPLCLVVRSVLIALIPFPFVMGLRANGDEKRAPKGIKAQTTVPVSSFAKYALHDFRAHRVRELRPGKDTDEWVKTLDPVTFDQKKSWAAFVALAGGDPDQPAENALIAEIAMLYHLAGMDKRHITLAAELEPESLEIKTGSVTVAIVPSGEKPVEMLIPYHGKTTVKLTAAGQRDVAVSRNGRIAWARISLDVEPDSGPFQNGGRVFSSRVAWFGVQSTAETPLKKSQFPILTTSAKDGKYTGGGIWDSAPADGKSFWVKQGWPKESMSQTIWNKSD